MTINKKALSKILKYKYFPEKEKKECDVLADLFIRSDFRKNHITTYAEAFIFLDYVQSLRSN